MALSGNVKRYGLPCLLKLMMTVGQMAGDIEQNNAVNMSQVCKDKAGSRVASLMCILQLIICNCQIHPSIASTALQYPHFPVCIHLPKLQGIHFRGPSRWKQESLTIQGTTSLNLLVTG